MHTAFEGRVEGHNVLAVTCDVSDKAQVAAMIDLAVKTYGLHQSLQGRTSWMLRHKRSHASPTRTLRPLCDKISMPPAGSDGLVVAGLAALTGYSAVFAELQQRAPLPLLSLVEAVCVATQALGLKRVGLFGTRFTM
jgi:aspartate/glutamate racemase